VLAQILNEYPEDIRVVYRHFPLISIHDKAALAAQASEAAGNQGKFWEIHDLLFARQQEWSQPEMTVEKFEDWLLETAESVGLDGNQFQEDLNSEELQKLAQASWDRGVAAGLPGTPLLMFNDRLYNGPMSQGNLDAIVKTLLLEKRQFTSCPEMTVDAAKQYVATMQTEKGDIQIELYADKAPLAVNNFIFLARQGWFDGITFHRVIPGFVAQSGDPSGTGFGGPGYAFDNEISDLKFDSAGIVGMANAGPGSNGSQFFITFAPVPDLDGGYTIFGKVISGMDVLENLAPRDPSQSISLPPGDTILQVTIEEN